MMEKSLTENFDINYKIVKENIKKAAQLSGRSEDDIILLAAVKTVSPELINYAIESGIKFIGDNRVQELKEKENEVIKSVEKHFIGHLQTNKVKDVINRVKMVESVDSLRLANEISKCALKNQKVMDILVEVNIGGEESKSGFSPNELESALKEIALLQGVKVRGLMCIPPVCQNREEKIKYFTLMQKLSIDIKEKNIDNINIDLLSMGMSDSYCEAIECGANLVRLGTVLFGKRNYF